MHKRQFSGGRKRRKKYKQTYKTNKKINCEKKLRLTNMNHIQMFRTELDVRKRGAEFERDLR